METRPGNLCHSTVTRVPLCSCLAMWAMPSSSRLRSPLRNSMRELRKWSRLASGQHFSSIGIRLQKGQPGWAGVAPVVCSSMSALLQFYGEDFVFQPCAAGEEGGHRSGQPDMAAERTDFDHQFVSLLEKTDLAFGGEGEKHAHFIAAVALGEGEGRFGAGDRGGVLALRVEGARHFLQPLLAQHFVREQGHPLDGNRREVGIDLLPETG